jgi:Zn-dependent peptidase ImmA (M78 family)
VNRHEHKNRQRFTIAHEIAHYVLHRDQIRNDLNSELTDDTFYRSGLSEKREWEANRLAAEILMPWPLIRTLTAAGKKTPRELAAELEVSESAISIRLGLPT